MPKTASEGEAYLRSWEALTAMLHEGRSWSGGERNGAFLNTGDGRFSAVAAVTGFDFAADGRGLALTDWDGDGDLDVWAANRTSPAAQFLLNSTSGASLSLKLEGTASNRDGIGARVELLGTDQPRVRTVRAGDGYLSQSSKRVHLALESGDGAFDVQVSWPAGTAETFSGLKPGRYRLIEGSGEAVAESMNRAPVRQAPGGIEKQPVTNVGRVVPHGSLPLPPLSWTPLGADEPEPLIKAGDKRPLVLNLWATSCPPCIAELREWTVNAKKLTAAGLRVAAISVDLPEASQTERTDLITQAVEPFSPSFEFGLSTRGLLENLDALGRVVCDRFPELPLPFSVLIDSKGGATAFYIGPVPPSRLLLDAGSLPGNDDRDARRNAAVPFPGKWFTDPMPPDLMALPRELFEIGRYQNAVACLTAGLSPAQLASDPALARVAPAEEVARFLLLCAERLEEGGHQTAADAAREMGREFE